MEQVDVLLAEYAHLHVSKVHSIVGKWVEQGKLTSKEAVEVFDHCRAIKYNTGPYKDV